jgi:nucleoside-diphosphate-sugar epimerase
LEKIDIGYQDGDCSKLKNEFHWEPEYKIEETLKDLLNY